MKKLIFLAVLFCFMQVAANAQSIKDVFNPDVPVTYLGIDFSHGRFYGPTPDLEATGVTFLTKSINRLVRDEDKKYDFKTALQKKTLVYNTDMTEKLNQTIVDKNYITVNTSDLNHLTAASIQSIVSGYDLGGLTGLGFIFITDNLNKERGEAVMWVTFIDMATKKVLLTEKMIGGAGGAGIRNFWARPFYEVLVQLKTKEFQNWRLKYG